MTTTQSSVTVAPTDVDRLVTTHLPLAIQLAGRFRGRGQSMDDLQQVASLGLVKAARRFDSGRDVAFATYATAVILGELKRHFRDHAWGVHVPRPVQETYLAVRQAREDLTQSLGRAPTVREVAERVNAGEEEVIEAINAASALAVDSLDRPAAEDNEGPRFEVPVHEPAFGRVEERSWLVPALGELPEREREILRLRFFESLSQSEIASRVGVSQMHVSRLLSRSLAKLREAEQSARSTDDA